MENVDKKILDWMDINSKNSWFITLTDHKENFLNNPTVRLINPMKSKLGRISKAILDNIGLYCDDRLGVVRKKGKPETEKIKKNI